MSDQATITLSDLVVTTFTKGLNTLTHVLQVAEAHAATQGINPDTEYLPARLIDDMRPLQFQLQNVTKHVRVVLGRLTGEEYPVWEDTETTIKEFYGRIEKARKLLEGVDKSKIDARAGEVVDHPFGPNITFKVSIRDSIFGHGLPNFYFHLTTAYAILRSKGVPVGKYDYVKEFFAPVEIPRR
ncbi:hypothetical protein QBC47DRAFT_187442 [Echria macrotheca]|uniref:DUF1993 domain-containing protein n=1 Tax=Echria macrotheca TaxID=438768 RepID=A0AAJ0F673_9PEZI|nr:hypothetical protein QBC47DRAFT_187442 [Echria macrotheca]